MNNVDGFLAGAICADLWKLSNTILGTRKKHDGGLVPPCIKRLVMRTDVRKLLKAVASCDVVVYDLHDADMEELELVLRVLHSSEIAHQMTFIIVSSVGVWSRTPRTYETVEVPAEENAATTGAGEEGTADPDAEGAPAEAEGEGSPAAGADAGAPARRPVPLESKDFSRRMPAPKFQEWKTIETIALALRDKGTVRPYIVCAGIPYGNGEECFLSLFKAAWQSKDSLRVIGDGNNFIPCVHARDCARLVRRIVETKPELEYHLAVDRSDVTQKDIVQAVATEFGVGYPVQSVTVPEAMLAELADILTIDLRLEPSPVMEPTPIEPEPVADEELPGEPEEMVRQASKMSKDASREASKDGVEEEVEKPPDKVVKPPVNFRWWCEKGVAANMKTVVAEFCRWRRLKPVRIVIFGPPGSGAGKLANMLAERYGVQAAAMDDVIERVRNLESPLGNALRDMLSQIEAAASNPKATGPFQISSELMTQMLEEAVLQKPSSRFRGSVISGFPSTIEEATKFFLEDSPVSEPAEGEASADSKADKVLRASVTPDLVVVLNSSEERCHQRSQEREPPVPEKEFTTKMNTWKTAFPEEGPKLTDILTERAVELLTLDVDDVSADELCEMTVAHFASIRTVYNFRIVQTADGAESKDQALEEHATTDDGAAQKEAERRRKKKEEEDRLEAIKKEEFIRLEKHSETLRSYLMQYVVPTLTTGLIDVCRETPEDPIAYLAEYLSSYSTEMVKVRRSKRQAAMSHADSMLTQEKEKTEKTK